MKNYFGEKEIVLFHGTNTHPDNILHKGFDNALTIWNCSDYNQVYFYEYKRWCECEGYDKDDEDSYEVILHRANEQAQIQNAVKPEPERATCVLEFHFPEEFGNYIATDSSCKNMEHFGSVQVNLNIINEYMQKGWCKVIVHTYPFAVKCSLMYLTGLVDNEYFEIDMLPDFEQEALRNLAKGEWNEDFYDNCISYVEELNHVEINMPLCDKLDYTFE